MVSSSKSPVRSKNSPRPHSGRTGGPKTRLEACHEVTWRHLLQLAFRGVKELLISLIRHLQASLGIEHADGISGRVEHCLESLITSFELLITGFKLPLVLCQLLFNVPLPRKRKRDLLNLLARKWLADIEQFVQQFPCR